MNDPPYRLPEPRITAAGLRGVRVYIQGGSHCSSCPSFVSVVKSSHLRQFNDSAHFRGVDGTRPGSIFVQRQMSSRLFVQVDNLIPIVLNRERSVIHGIRGMGVLSGFMERL